MWQRWQRWRGVAPWHPLFVILLACTLAACDTPTSSGQHPAGTATVSNAPTVALPSLHKGWNQVASPVVGQEGRLEAVAALPGGDAWAVGQFQGPNGLQQTLTERW